MARKSHTDSEPPSFEQNLDRLEGIIKRLEESELPLEEALKLFEEGTTLSAGCKRQLEEAEHRVEILTRTAHGVAPEPMQDLSAGE
jgi:exodeoxyribonuclease VII small subunit